jgi:hypothetical protein
MRLRRVVVFAAIVAAHFLVLWLFPSGYTPRESAEQQVSFATLMVPEPITEKAGQPEPRGNSVSSRLKHAAPAARPTPTPGIGQAKARGAAVGEPQVVQQSRTALALIDWGKEVQIAADNRMRQDAETSRQAAALSQWRSHVMPSPNAPETSQFRWDYARTHRLESSALGLNVNLNDRCSLLISLYMMAIMGGCKLGELPVHGDLFLHMKDDPTSSAPAP